MRDDKCVTQSSVCDTLTVPKLLKESVASISAFPLKPTSKLVTSSGIRVPEIVALNVTSPVT